MGCRSPSLAAPYMSTPHFLKCTERWVTPTSCNARLQGYASFSPRCLRGCDVVHAKKGRAMARPQTRLKGALGGDQALAVWSLLPAVLTALLPLAIAYAQSPLVAELEAVATSYHNDPT